MQPSDLQNGHAQTVHSIMKKLIQNCLMIAESEQLSTLEKKTS